MHLKKFLKKSIYLFKQNQSDIFIIILVSILLSCYFIFFIMPFGGYLDIGDISYSATIFDKIKYSLFIIPFIIWYFIIILDTLKKIKFVRIIVYPTILILLWLCMFMCMTIFGYEKILLYFFSSCYILPILMVITEIYAIIQDIKTFKNTSLPTEKK